MFWNKFKYFFVLFWAVSWVVFEKNKGIKNKTRHRRKGEIDSYQTNEVVQKKLCCHGELGLWFKRLFFFLLFLIIEKIDPSVKRVVWYFIYEKWPEIKQVYWFYGFLSSKETFFFLAFLFKWFCQNILGIQNTTPNNLTFRHGNTLESTYTQHCFVMFGQNIYVYPHEKHKYLCSKSVSK